MTSHRLILLPALLALLLLFPDLGAKPFSSRGEPREALVPQAMVTSGNWILPRRYGENLPTKPPLSHWISATASLPEGKVTEFSARFPSALFSLMTVAGISLLVGLFRPAKEAALAAFILLTSFEWYRASVTARVDMTLSGCLVLGWCAFLQGTRTGRQRWHLLAGLFFAGATLAKGPIGIVLPGLVVTCFLLWERIPLKEIASRLLVLFVPAAVIPLIWYGLAYRQAGEKFLRVVYDENFGRFTSTMSAGEDPHSHSPLYLYTTLAIGLLPWTFAVILHGVAELRAAWDARGATPLWEAFRHAVPRWIRAGRRWPASQGPLERLAVLVIVITLGFYSIPASKRSVYLLPLYPFVCILLSRYLITLGAQRSSLCRSLLRGAHVCFAVLGGVTLLTAVALGIFSFRPFQSFWSDGLLTASESVTLALSRLSLTCWLLIGLFAALPLSLLPRLREAFSRPVAVLSLYYAFLLLLQTTVLPAVAGTVAGKDFAEVIDAQVPSDARLFSFGQRYYGLNFYLGGSMSDLTRTSLPADTFYVLLPEKDLPKLVNLAGPGRLVTTLSRSTGGVGKITTRAVLAEVQ